LVLAASPNPMTAQELAREQDMPGRFLAGIMTDLRRADIVVTQRGSGGYRLARAADAITLADVMRTLDGPLARVRGMRPEATDYDGPAKHLQGVWIAVRAQLRILLEHVTLSDVIAGRLPDMAGDLLGRPAPLVLHAPVDHAGEAPTALGASI